MISEIGAFSLSLALGFSVLQTVSSYYGAKTGFHEWTVMGRTSSYIQFFLVSLSLIALTLCFVNNDFSVAYVAANSNSALPLAYRISAVWGAHEGSLLLWVFILALWTIVFTATTKSLPARFVCSALSFLGVVSIGFILFTLFTSNPFLRLFPTPLDGGDLNPLLQDPGLIIHPPMLYIGYVGFAVVFAIALAALSNTQYIEQWSAWARPWALAAWAFLTLGIALGSWWAYYELGWGGWWFWDPVENASLMPWLIGTALIHSLAATDNLKTFHHWSLLLAIVAFGLSLLGTFLVRSGVLTSVHAFASDPARGVFILLFLAIVVGGALSLYAIKSPAIKSNTNFELVSRETFLLLNSVILSVITGTVLLGTLYPLIIDALGLGKLSVGPPYFNAVVIPLGIPLLVLVGIGQTAKWKRDEIMRLFVLLKYPFFGAILLALGAILMLNDDPKFMALTGLILAFWVIGSTIRNYIIRRNGKGKKQTLATIKGSYFFWGRSLGHVGFALTVIGISLVSTYEEAKHLKMTLGDKATLSGRVFEFHELKEITGPNYRGTQATFKIATKQQAESKVIAEKRFYEVRGMTMTEAGILPSLKEDLYVSLGEPLENGAWSVRLNIKPFVRLLWLGALIMAIGGAVSARGLCIRLEKPVRTARVIENSLV